jgi:hypothetical protein
VKLKNVIVNITLCRAVTMDKYCLFTKVLTAQKKQCMMGHVHSPSLLRPVKLQVKDTSREEGKETFHSIELMRDEKTKWIYEYSSF